MRRNFFFSFLLILALSHSVAFSQKPQHFYNVDKEIKIEGTIQKIIIEPLTGGDGIDVDKARGNVTVEKRIGWK